MGGGLGDLGEGVGYGSKRVGDLGDVGALGEWIEEGWVEGRGDGDLEGKAELESWISSKI